MWLLLVVVGTLLVGACSSSGSSAGDKKPTTQSSSAPSGSIVVGADQTFQCADWIDACATSSWGRWTLEVSTMPRAFDPIKQDGGSYTYVPNVLLAGAPKLVTTPKQIVTYRINPKAVWSDGTPITSADFKYTWEQIAFGPNIYDRSGYANIESIDATDPHTAVVTFARAYPVWQSLFGGRYGLFPSHILQGKDRHALMKDGYSWSGGPWVMKSWDKSASLVLEANPKWYGPDKPTIKQVTFEFFGTTPSEFEAFKSGEVLAISPQPEPDVVAQIATGLPDTNSTYDSDTGSYEALWMNNASAPLDDPVVRRAISYAIDRPLIVRRLFGKVGMNRPLQVLNAPIVASFSDTQAFSQYDHDLDKANSLLTGDGWVKDANGIYAKNGNELVLALTTTENDARRQMTELIVQQSLTAIGIKTTVTNQSSNDLFATTLPNGAFQLAIYTQDLTSLDPGRCFEFCTSSIPSGANNLVGQNYTRTSVAPLDSALQTVDNSLDDKFRTQSNKQADRLTAQNAVSLPLDQLVNLGLWSKKIDGPVSYNALLGLFWNMQDWTLKSS